MFTRWPNYSSPHSKQLVISIVFWFKLFIRSYECPEFFFIMNSYIKIYHYYVKYNDSTIK